MPTPVELLSFIPTNATTKQSLADWAGQAFTNVLNFRNAGNDSAMVQAAVNWTSGPNRGTIYFPSGSYSLTTPVTFNYNGNLAIRFLGSQGSNISGNFSGWLLDRSLGSPNNTIGGRVFEKLNFNNTFNGGGCVRIGSTIGASFKDCTFAGDNGVTTEDIPGTSGVPAPNSSQCVSFENCVFNAVTSSSPNGNSLLIGGSGFIAGCDWAACNVGIRAYGNGLLITGNRIERSNTAYLFGLDSGDNDVGMSGFSINGGTTEGVTTSIYFQGTCSGFSIGPLQILGHPASNNGFPGNITDTQYGVRIPANKASYGSIGCGITGTMGTAGMSVGTSSSRTNLAISGTATSWSFPTNAYSAFFANNINTTPPVWTFAALPTGGNVLEGDEFNVSDINSGWGTAYTGGGTTHGLVRWNGSAWTVVAI